MVLSRTTTASLLALLSIVAPACAAAPQGGRPEGALSGAASQDDHRTLVVAMRFEPKTLTGSALNPTFQGISPGAPWQIFHAGLTQQDEKNSAHLQLAEAFPQLGTDSWKVFPDGRMETTWRLRPNLTWHDGAPLVADDFVLSADFSKTVSTGVQEVDTVSAPDPRTVVIRYKVPTAEAGEITWQPLPRHSVGASLEQLEGREAFATLPYWTTEFVGVGPYRLEQWEPGAFITGVAFPAYVYGKPRIGRIQLVWIADANATVANLLSGTVHLATDLSIAFEQVSVLRSEWMSVAQSGSILLGTSKTVYAQVQFRPDYAKPSAMLDVRFRQALAHAIDKQALVDAVLDGEPGTADTLIAREEEYYSELDRLLTKYSLDLKRTDQLLTELGFTKDGEGFYGRSGSRLGVGMQVASGAGSYPREALILADGWKRVGVEGSIHTLSATEQLDQEIGSTFPGLRLTQFQIDAYPFQPFTSATISSPATRWAGPNRGGYFDPELDRLSALYTGSLDRSDRNRAVMQAMKLVGEQAAYFPLYYGYDVVAHTGAFSGPRGARQKNALWKLEEWSWR